MLLQASTLSPRVALGVSEFAKNATATLHNNKSKLLKRKSKATWCKAVLMNNLLFDYNKLLYRNTNIKTIKTVEEGLFLYKSK